MLAALAPRAAACKLEARAEHQDQRRIKKKAGGNPRPADE
jgi:hypothetical protein